MNKNKKICILLGAHLCRAPRSVKEANALSKAGYEVVVLAPFLESKLVQEDTRLTANRNWVRKAPVDLRRGKNNLVFSFYYRVKRKIAQLLHPYFKFLTPHFLGYGLNTMLKAAIREKADLYIGHQEVGLWLTYQLQEKGFKVGVDIEDWYSKQRIEEKKQSLSSKYLEYLEGQMLRKSSFSLTTSKILAEELAAYYGAPAPAIIYNTFPFFDRQKIDHKFLDRPSNQERTSLFWFSQTIGLDRGLDTLFMALTYVSIPVEVHLRGKISDSTKHQLINLFPVEKGHTLYFHHLVSPKELLSRIAEHDIGLALEKSHTASRAYSITNKFFQYLIGGLPILATETEGQLEIAAQLPEVVYTFPEDNAAKLGASINYLLEQPGVLEQAKKQAVQAAEKYFSWERQIPVLQKVVQQVLL